MVGCISHALATRPTRQARPHLFTRSLGFCASSGVSQRELTVAKAELYPNGWIQAPQNWVEQWHFQGNREADRFAVQPLATQR
jgi:hypothetical protein